MKKFIIFCTCAIILFFAGDFLIYRMGWYIDWNPDAPVTTQTTVEGKKIYLDQGNGMEEFEIRGVDMGIGIPGHFATDYAIDKETYLRWFQWIKEMGANTIRVYTIQCEDFYDAFYEYNVNNDDPLYLLHGLWVNDYVQNSHMDAYDPLFFDTMIDDSRVLVDVIHGNRSADLGETNSGRFTKDVSPWVIGYILGVEWEDVTVVYTDHMEPERAGYQGEYMYTTEDATPFETLLARVGDNIISYESKRYKQQRLVAFSNWPTTDPFDYPLEIKNYFRKMVKVDVEHIKTTDAFLSGQFASYHVYPYYPDYLNYMDDISGYTDPSGQINTYYAYLKTLVDHHSMPVVISEYGTSSSRGMTQYDRNTGRNQGGLSEQEQGQAIVDCYRDIMAAGCAGSVIFTWQDEWFKRTWNTMHAVDLTKTPYWSDYQTNEQYFGLLSFDPGEERSVSYVDGDLEEWTEDDIIQQDETSSISMKYDEKFLYFLVWQEGFSDGAQTLYLPVDITPKTGSTYCEDYDLKFEDPADFLMIIDGRENSRVLVQRRYNVLRAMYFHETDGEDPYESVPDKDMPVFDTIRLILQTATALEEDNPDATSETYETGLLTYGNANPSSPDFNSLADFCFAGDYVEIKIPWQLFNFCSPAERMVHDDYYEHYGVEPLEIDHISVGVGTEETAAVGDRIAMADFPLTAWNRNVTYHERLKESYYMVQEMWTQ